MRRTGKEGLHTRVKQTKEVKEREVIQEQLADIDGEVYILVMGKYEEPIWPIGVYSTQKELFDAKTVYLKENPDVECTDLWTVVRVLGGKAERV